MCMKKGIRNIKATRLVQQRCAMKWEEMKLWYNLWRIMYNRSPTFPTTALPDMMAKTRANVGAGSAWCGRSEYLSSISDELMLNKFMTLKVESKECYGSLGYNQLSIPLFQQLALALGSASMQTCRIRGAETTNSCLASWRDDISRFDSHLGRLNMAKTMVGQCK